MLLLDYLSFLYSAAPRFRVSFRHPSVVAQSLPLEPFQFGFSALFSRTFIWTEPMCTRLFEHSYPIPNANRVGKKGILPSHQKALDQQECPQP